MYIHVCAAAVLLQFVHWIVISDVDFQLFD